MSNVEEDSRSSLGSQVEEENWEDWEEDESDGVKSLFSSETFASIDAAIDFDKNTHGFDIRKWRTDTGASEYDTLKAINYIRAETEAGRDPRSQFTADLSTAPWQDDGYLRPVLENDEFLFHDWEAETPGTAADNDQPKAEDNDDLVAMLEDMRQLALGDAAVMELLNANLKGTIAEEPVPVQEEKGESSKEAQKTEAEAIDDRYFESYSFFDIHREMLGDRIRTEAYQKALELNPSLIAGKTVLDVGCGTGVLSMFAARGGAEQVVAVDGSPEIASVARKICAANGFGGEIGDKIGILSSRVEALQELPGLKTPDGKVDVLVSEWMGYALLFECMLDSVLNARDKFLRPGGAVLPDIATIFIAAAEEGASGIDFWHDVYGLNMDVVAESLHQAALKEAVVRVVHPRFLLTEAQQIVSLDLATMKAADQDFTSEFELKAASGPKTCAALVLWFETEFSERFCKEAPEMLSTGPYGTPTHWAQTILVLPQPVELAPAVVGAPGAATALKGTISMSRSHGRRRTLDIVVQYYPVMADGKNGETRVQLYSLGVGGSK